MRCIFQDTTGIIWIGTDEGGINLFNPVTEKIKRYVIFTGDSLDPMVRTVESIYADRQNRLWIATTSRGVFKINSDRKTIKNG